MCGRFFVVGESENDLLARMIDEADRRRQALTGESGIATGEVFPAMTVAALAVGRNGAVGAFPMQWGFHRPDGKGLIINVRSETAMEKPLFRASLLERRCLIPCSWYFEWETRNGQQSLLAEDTSLQIGAAAQRPKGRAKDAQKIKYAIRPKAPGLVYLAGIYRYETDARLPALSILTRETAADIAFIHDRMPVIFRDGNHGAWLDRAADPRGLLEKCEREMTYRAA